MYEMVTEHFDSLNFSVVVAKFWVLGFVMLHKTTVFSLYCNSDLDD